MSDGSVDKGKGKAKVAAGELTGDQDLKNKGQVDKASGHAKDGVDKVKDALKGKG